MARLKENGTIVLNDGTVLYADDNVRVEALRELSELLIPQSVNYAGGGSGGFSTGGGRTARGSQGPTGDGFEGGQGSQGNQGAQGTNPGPQGNQGNQGNQGVTGTFGVQGFQGFQGGLGGQGFQGSGVQGFQGPQGFQGFQGTQGTQGTQGFQGTTGFPLLAPDGSAAAPSYSFSGETTMGMYRSGSGSLSFAVGGAEALRLTASQTLGKDGTAAAPGFAFTGATGNGMFNISATSIGFAQSGVESLRISEPADGDTSLMVRRNVAAVLTLVQVSMGAVDSGGVGFKLLRVPN